MERRYNVQALGEAPEITYHDDLFPESVFLREYFSALDDHVPAVTLLRTAGCACLPLISIPSSLETC